MIEIQHTPDGMAGIHAAVEHSLIAHNRLVARMLHDLEPRLMSVADAFEASARAWLEQHEAWRATLTKKQRRHLDRLHNPPPRRGRKR